MVRDDTGTLGACSAGQSAQRDKAQQRQPENTPGFVRQRESSSGAGGGIHAPSIVYEPGPVQCFGRLSVRTVAYRTLTDGIDEPPRRECEPGGGPWSGESSRRNPCGEPSSGGTLAPSVYPYCGRAGMNRGSSGESDTGNRGAIRPAPGGAADRGESGRGFTGGARYGPKPRRSGHPSNGRQRGQQWRQPDPHQSGNQSESKRGAWFVLQRKEGDQSNAPQVSNTRREDATPWAEIPPPPARTNGTVR